jgi:hypothetical protein
MIRNFKGHYLVVGSNFSKTNLDQPECDLNGLGYELLSREVGGRLKCLIYKFHANVAFFCK